jgi:hypothetical protein
MNFWGYVDRACFYEPEDDLEFSIAVLVFLILVILLVSKGMPIVESNLFLFFLNNFSNSVRNIVTVYLYYYVGFEDPTGPAGMCRHVVR